MLLMLETEDASDSRELDARELEARLEYFEIEELLL